MGIIWFGLLSRLNVRHGRYFGRYSRQRVTIAMLCQWEKSCVCIF